MKLSILFILSMFMIQCAKTELDNPDYFIFGRYENVCLKDCSNFVKYESNNLYRDDVKILSDVITFNSNPLPLDYLSDVKFLRDNITNYMNSHTGDFGCPNCDGKGAYYVEIRKNNEVKKWKLDDDRTKITDDATKLYLDRLITTCQQFTL